MEQNETQERYREAKRLFGVQDYVGSLAVLEELADNGAAHREITYLRACCLAKLTRVSEAWALCEELDSAGDEDPRVDKLKAELAGMVTDEKEIDAPQPPADPISFTEGAAARGGRGFELAALIFLVVVSFAACGGVLWLVTRAPRIAAPQTTVPPLAKAIEAPQTAVPPLAQTPEAPQVAPQTPEPPASENSEKQVEQPVETPQPTLEKPVGTLPAPPPGERKVSFPTESSRGTLRIREWGSADEDAWIRLGEARGGVVVPAAMELRIDLYTVVTVDMSFLDAFKDGTFQGLGLARTDAGDTDLAYLKSQSGLVWMDFRGTRITDNGLVHLEALPRLQRLDLRDTRVTEAGIGKLKQALPHCHIVGP